jgi:ATP-binding cassette subfamily B (MDR/TAP) protein 1
MTTPSPASSSNVAINEKHGMPSEEVKPPMAGLSEQEREIIERQLDAPKLQISYFALFRYANKNEVLIMVVALIASIAAGATMPLMTVGHTFFLLLS